MFSIGFLLLFYRDFLKVATTYNEFIQLKYRENMDELIHIGKQNCIAACCKDTESILSLQIDVNQISPHSRGI